MPKATHAETNRADTLASADSLSATSQRGLGQRPSTSEALAPANALSAHEGSETLRSPQEDVAGAGGAARTGSDNGAEDTTVPLDGSEASSVSAIMAPWIGREIDGRYRIVAPLGEGGMGLVFVAEHLALGKEVALKVIQPDHERSSELAARFAREAMVTAKVENPHVIPALDYGTLADGSAYLVTQLARGKTLRAYLARKQPFPCPLAAHLGAQIADGLAAAHAEGIVHRDLKPENIILQATDYGTLLVRILDFGLAQKDDDGGSSPPSSIRSETHALTRTGTVMGTPGYMAPEQALGERVDFRADLYALGVLLWEMSAGRHLFYHEKPSQAVAKQLAGEAPRLSDEVPLADVPEAFEALVQRLLAREVEDRPVSAAEVRERLQAFVPSSSYDLARVTDSIRPAVVGEDGVAAVSDLASAPTLLSDKRKPGDTPLVAHASDRISSEGHPSQITSVLTRWPVALLLALVLVLVGALAAAAGFIWLQNRAPDVAAVDGTLSTLSAEEESAVAQGGARLPEPVLQSLQTLATSEDKEARKQAANMLQFYQPATDVPAYALPLVDLELSSTCRDMLAAITEVEALGDFRALPVLLWLHNRPKSGCGSNRAKDCYGCIRTDIRRTIDRLRQARIESAKAG